MAGNHPDIPAPRIEYDRDGTRVYYIANGIVTEISLADLQTLNNESNAGRVLNGGNLYALLWVFPELKDITHMYLDAAVGMGLKVEWSVDSTTGLDGTWTQAYADFPNDIAKTIPSGYRNNIQVATGLTGVKMLRIWRTDANTWNSDHIYSAHLYGKASAAQTLHRLRLWHPTLDEPLDNYPAHFDWGNAEQGSSATRQFRVKNGSASLAASGVTVLMQALSDANPTQVSQHQLSLDGTTFQAANLELAIPNLAAQAISGVLHLRRNTLSNAQLGIWRQRLVVSADAWA